VRKRERDGEGGKAKRWKRKRGRREGTSKREDEIDERKGERWGRRERHGRVRWKKERRRARER
jgi:hypothetical protein